MSSTDGLSSAELNQLVEMLREKYGDPSMDDMLLMEFHIATLEYAKDDPKLADLIQLTKARFTEKYGDVIQDIRNVVSANQRDRAAGEG